MFRPLSDTMAIPEVHMGDRPTDHSKPDRFGLFDEIKSRLKSPPDRQFVKSLINMRERASRRPPDSWLRPLHDAPGQQQ
jgi:hypothetical protein